jgi:hypothetical protein
MSARQIRQKTGQETGAAGQFDLDPAAVSGSRKNE